MQLSSATALIAVLMILLLSAGYAATERSQAERGLSETPSQDSRS